MAAWHSLGAANIRFIPRAELEFDEVPLDSGAFGAVYKGTWKGTAVAIKKLLRPEEEREEVRFVEEVRNWSSVSHSNGEHCGSGSSSEDVLTLSFRRYVLCASDCSVGLPCKPQNERILYDCRAR